MNNRFMRQERSPVQTTGLAPLKARLAGFGLTLLISLALSGCKPATSETSQTAPAATGVPATQIFADLLSPNFTNAPLAGEQANAIKASLAKLAALGPNAIPAVGEFLQRNLDLAFDVPDLATRIGAPSLRVSLIQWLGQSPSPEALAILTRTVQSTADPLELAALARGLEQAAPGKYRTNLLAAARESLAFAAEPSWDGRDVAPLFDVMVRSGADASDVERHVKTWPGYVAVFLLALPNGAGLPALIKLAENTGPKPPPGLGVAQRLLAEAAIHDSSAALALTNLARAGKINSDAWPGVGAAMAGHVFLAAQTLERASGTPPPPGAGVANLAVGNQHFLDVPSRGQMPAAEIGARIRLIDQLLEGNNDPAALDALEGARIALSARLDRPK